MLFACCSVNIIAVAWKENNKSVRKFKKKKRSHVLLLPMYTPSCAVHMLKTFLASRQKISSWPGIG